MADKAADPGRAGSASLSARAREAVLQRIVDRRYAQGARLVEREVAEELGMSRVPVREALVDISGVNICMPLTLAA
ncbi:GntR family transcriptional regulator, partial [Streptomyces sp. NPDC000963]